MAFGDAFFKSDAVRRSSATSLIWKRPVNVSRIRFFGFFVGSSSQAEGVVVEAVIATVDQSDIRGSEPQSVDPSGAASDYERGLGGWACRIETSRILLSVSASTTTRSTWL